MIREIYSEKLRKNNSVATNGALSSVIHLSHACSSSTCDAERSH